MIYGRENGWDDSTRHSGHQIHPQQQVLEARVEHRNRFVFPIIVTSRPTLEPLHLFDERLATIARTNAMMLAYRKVGST